MQLGVIFKAGNLRLAGNVDVVAEASDEGRCGVPCRGNGLLKSPEY